MPPALVANTAAATSNTRTVTTPAINTTGATFFVAAVTSWEPSVEVAVTDTQGNAWTNLPAFFNTGNTRVRLSYATSALVGPSHTFSYLGPGTGNQAFCALAVAAFRGIRLVAPLDGQSGTPPSGASVTTLQPGSVTPTQSAALLVTALGFDNSQTVTVNLGFTITNQVNYGGSMNFGIALAYLVQATPAAINPTWTLPVASNPAATLASFVAVKAPPPLRRPWRFYRRAA